MGYTHVYISTKVSINIQRMVYYAGKNIQKPFINFSTGGLRTESRQTPSYMRYYFQ